MCIAISYIVSLFRFNIKGHQSYICNDEFVKSAFSYVFNNSEAIAIKNDIFLLIRQDSKNFQYFSLILECFLSAFFPVFTNIIFISDWKILI